MPTSKRRRKRPVRSWVGWSMVALGGLSFLVGNIGARTGAIAIPFDPHHVFAQFGGAILAIAGLIVATKST